MCGTFTGQLITAQLQQVCFLRCGNGQLTGIGRFQQWHINDPSINVWSLSSVQSINCQINLSVAFIKGLITPVWLVIPFCTQSVPGFTMNILLHTLLLSFQQVTEIFLSYLWKMVKLRLEICRTCRPHTRCINFIFNFFPALSVAKFIDSIFF